MRTTALLTLTGTGSVIREWLHQISAGAGAGPEMLLLCLAILGLGLQTLYSHRSGSAAETKPTPSVSEATQPGSVLPMVPSST